MSKFMICADGAAANTSIAQTYLTLEKQLFERGL